MTVRHVTEEEIYAEISEIELAFPEIEDCSTVCDCDGCGEDEFAFRYGSRHRAVYQRWTTLRFLIGE